MAALEGDVEMGAREDLHRLVDELDDDALRDAAEVLSRMVSPRTPDHDDLDTPRRRRLSFVGTLSSGQGDLAARSDEILRAELGRSER